MKKKNEKVYQQVRNYVENFVTHVSKERTAKALGMKTSKVEDAFRRLNREGMITKAVKTSCRDSAGRDKKKCWHPDIYLLRK